MNYLKVFNAKLQSLDRSKSISAVFNDFLSLSTYALVQPFYRSDDIEQKYKYIINQYTKEQAEDFSQLLAFLVAALEEKHQDFLGQVFAMNNIGNANKGQFFTPYNVSKMMSEINIVDIEAQLEKRDYITLSELCCGSGGMIIAFAETLKANCYNYQHQLYVEAVDIDETCFKMTYLQLSLLGVPAKVIRGDSLSLKFYEALYTPFYFLANFEYKLKQRTKSKELEPVTIKKTAEENSHSHTNQLTLFNFL